MTLRGKARPLTAIGFFTAAVAVVVASGAAATTGPLSTIGARSADSAASSLVIANSDVPVSLDTEGPDLGDAPSVEAMAQVYAPLVEYTTVATSGGARVPNYSAGMTPALAQSWTVSSNHLTWTFHLRKGVKSMWGNKFTAADVVWSVQRAFAMKSTGAFFLQVSGVQSPSSVKAVGKFTVQYHLSQPSNIFLDTRANFLDPIYDSVEAKKYATPSDPWATSWIVKNGGGFGPYSVSTWVPGRTFVMKANPNYYGGTPKIQTITVEAVASDATRLAALDSGAVDIAENLTPQDDASLVGNAAVKIWDVLPGNANDWLILNTAIAPLNNVLVRQAIAYAMPYNSIVQSVFKGHATVWKNLVPLGYPDVLTKYWHYNTNLAKARALMAKAGHAKGVSLTINYSTGNPNDGLIAILLGQALNQIGIKTTLAEVTPAIFSEMKLTRAARLKTNILLSSGDVSWIPDYSYAAGYFFTSTALFNPIPWKDSQFDSLAAQAAVETNASKRIQLLDQMQQILLTQLPYIPIAMTGLRVAMRANVHGYVWYPDDYMRFVTFSK